MSFAPDHPAQLFTDAELEPVEVVKIRFLWEKDGATWAGRCRACSAYLSWEHTKDEARRAGLAGLGGHRCVGPGTVIPF